MVYTPINYNGINTIFAAANHEGNLIMNRVNTNASKVLTHYEHLQNTIVSLIDIKALIIKVIPQINREIDSICSAIDSKKERLKVGKQIKYAKKGFLDQLYKVRANIQFAVNHHQVEHDNETKEFKKLANNSGANFIDMSHLSADMNLDDELKAIHDAINHMN